MARTYTDTERKALQERITELVNKQGRMTMSELERATGAGWHSVRRCLVDVLASGALYMHGKHGIFSSELAHKEWCKNPVKKDSDLVRKLPDGEIRCYDRNQNIICRECRNSEVMQRVLAFYRGSFQEVAQ